MSNRTVPFHYSFFAHAMMALLGREPDFNHAQGFDGFYSFRYEPRDENEKQKFRREVVVLREWLKMFEITPLESICEYGRLTTPQKGEEGKDYLYIRIVHEVRRGEN